MAKGRLNNYGVYGSAAVSPEAAIFSIPRIHSTASSARRAFAAHPGTGRARACGVHTCRVVVFIIFVSFFPVHAPTGGKTSFVTSRIREAREKNEREVCSTRARTKKKTRKEKQTAFVGLDGHAMTHDLACVTRVFQTFLIHVDVSQS